MKHFATPEFWEALASLPKGVQKSARKNFKLLENDPRHPSLQFKKAGAYWSVRANRGYRALATEEEDGYAWFWIGPHDVYMRMLKDE